VAQVSVTLAVSCHDQRRYTHPCVLFTFASLQNDLARPIITLLQKPYHERQAALRPNVIQVIPAYTISAGISGSLDCQIQQSADALPCSVLAHQAPSCNMVLHQRADAAGVHRAVPAAAQGAQRADPLPGQDVLRVAQCHLDAGAARHDLSPGPALLRRPGAQTAFSTTSMPGL
jgi:hypothetical protein